MREKIKDWWIFWAVLAAQLWLAVSVITGGL